MKQLLLSISFPLLFACKTAKAPKTLLFSNLINFIIRQDVHFTDDVSYFYFTNETDFRNTFTLTKSSPGNMVIPDFATQRVIAVALKPTKDIFEVKLLSTEISGNELDVYYTRLPSSGISFLHTPFSVASIPIPTSIVRVNFYNGKSKEKMIEIDSN